MTIIIKNSLPRYLDQRKNFLINIFEKLIIKKVIIFNQSKIAKKKKKR